MDFNDNAMPSPVELFHLPGESPAAPTSSNDIDFITNLSVVFENGALGYNPEKTFNDFCRQYCPHIDILQALKSSPIGDLSDKLNEEYATVNVKKHRLVL